MQRCRVILSVLCAAAVVPGQALTSSETAQQARVVFVMMAFARQAELSRMPTRAQAVYEEVLAHYDKGHRAALEGRGYREVKGGWQPPAEPKRVEDTASASQQAIVLRDEQTMRRRCAAIHRETGVALLAAGNTERGRYQLMRALAHDPGDVAAHKALGNEELDGCWGTGEEIAFLRRFKAIAAKAAQVRKTEYALEKLDAAAMPPELKATGVPLTGARSEKCTFWLEGIQADTDRVVQMATRCHVLLEFLVGSGRERFPVEDERLWACLTTRRESYLAFVDANGSMLKFMKPERARQSGNAVIRCGDKIAEFFHYHPGTLDDAVVANVAHRAWTDSANPALGEGLSHVLTWLICGSVQTVYVAADKDAAPSAAPDPQQWLKIVRADVAAGRDPPLQDILLERFDNLRTDSRRKAWLFVLWLVARHQDRFGDLAGALSAPKDRDQCLQDFAKELGRPLAEVEQEWRAWALGQSPLAKASGLGR